MNRGYWEKTLPQREKLVRFDRQKEYLTNNAPVDFGRFSEIFRFNQTTKAQAAELLPRLSTYKSNLIAQVDGKIGRERAQLQAGTNYVGFVETQFKRILNPLPPAATNGTAKYVSREPVPAVQQPSVPKPLQPPIEPASTNILLVNQFFKIPVGRLRAQQLSELAVFANRWREGKIWLDLGYTDIASNEQVLRFQVFRGAATSWDPKTDQWEVIQYPGHENPTDPPPVGFMGDTGKGLHFEVFDGAFYRSEWEAIKKYDFQTRHWQTLNFPGQKLAQLSAIGGHLFAANDENIFEILDQGREVDRMRWGQAPK